MQMRMADKELEHDRDMNTMNQANSGDEAFYEQQQQQESLTRWQQDLNDDINRAVHTLKREIYDDEKQEWVAQLEFNGKYEEKEGKRVPVYNPMKPMMNDLGISFFKSQTMPSMSRNLIMSNYKEVFIFTKLKSITKTFVRNMVYNYEEYDVNKGDLSGVVSIFKATIEPTFFRCLNAGERQSQKEMRKVVEAYAYGKPTKEKPKGFLGNMLGG